VVNSFLESSFFSIVVNDVVVDLFEDGESVGVFFFSSITSVIGGNEVNEFSFSFTDWGR
jgi:hypothetical protein